jgi:hypothetical protein
MTRALLALGAVLVLTFLTGCGASMVPFTHEIRAEHSLTKEDLKNLQYYISTRVTLRRELDSDKKQITGSHKLILTSGKVIEEVVVEEKTPGVAIDVGPRSITVSFEPGSSIEFGPQGGRTVPASASHEFATGPDPFPGNNTVAHDKEAEPFSSDGAGNYFMLTESSGTITYQGRQFQAVEGSLEAHLMIDAEALNRVEKSRKVLPGMRLAPK